MHSPAIDIAQQQLGLLSPTDAIIILATVAIGVTVINLLLTIYNVIKTGSITQKQFNLMKERFDAENMPSLTMSVCEKDSRYLHIKNEADIKVDIKLGEVAFCVMPRATTNIDLSKFLNSLQNKITAENKQASSDILYMQVRTHGYYNMQLMIQMEMLGDNAKWLPLITGIEKSE